MSRVGLLFVVLVVLCSAGLAVAAPTVALTPSTMTTTTADGVVVNIGGIVGPKVDLVVYVDVNQNGAVDATDYRVFAVVVTDNAAAGPNVPADGNPAVGAASVRLRSFTPYNFPYTAGRYVVRVADEGNGTFADAALTIVAAAEAQSVQGHVAAAAGGTVPGALVTLMGINGNCAGTSPSTIADASGNFTLQVPASFDSCGRRMLLAFKPGYVTPQAGQPLLTFRGGDAYSGQTTTIAAGTVNVSGRLTFRGTTTPIPGALMTAYGYAGGKPTTALAFTDIGGAYTLPLVAGKWNVYTGSDEHLALHGAVGVGAKVVETVTSTAISGVDFSAEAPNATIAGEATDAGAPAGAGLALKAQSVSCGGKTYSTIVRTTAAGTYTAPIYVPSSCGAGQTTLDYQIAPVEPVFDKIVAGRYVAAAAGGSYGAAIDIVAPTHSIVGDVVDVQGAVVADACVEATESVDGGWRLARAKVGCDGGYALPVVDGAWAVKPGTSIRSPNYAWLAEQTFDRTVTVAGADVEAVRFVLGPQILAPTIVGAAEGAPKAGGQLLLHVQGVYATTDATIDGTTYAGAVTVSRLDQGRVAVALPAGLAAGAHQIAVVDSLTGTASAPACFTTTAPAYAPVCTIGGTVRDAGGAALPNAAVVVLDATGKSPLWATTTDANGQWSAGMPRSANYVVQYIAPQGSALSPAAKGPVACATGLTQQLAAAYNVTGTIESTEGASVSGTVVNAEGAGQSVSAVVPWGDFSFALPLAAGQWTISYQPPVGGRYVAPASTTITVSGDTTLPYVQMPAGNLVAGQVAGMDGTVRATKVLAHRRADDQTAGGTAADSCTGRFALAVPAGEYSLELINQPSDGATARVEWVNASNGDVAADFPFPAATAAPLQLDSTTLRVTGDLEAGLKVGGPFHFLAENIPATGTPQFVFSDGRGGTAPVTDLFVDRIRGLAAGTVPPGAASGPATFSVGAAVAAPVLADVLSGAAPARPYAFTGTVMDNGGTPVPNAILILMARDSNDPNCNADSKLVGFGLSDASGAFNVPHFGGDLTLMALPPVSSGLPADYILVPGATGDVAGMPVTLEDGATYTMRIVRGASATPVPNARVSLDGLPFDTRLSGADGTITFPIWGSPIAVASGPAKSRLANARLYVDAGGPAALGDVALADAVFVSGRALDPSGAPLGGARARTQEVHGESSYGDAPTGPGGIFSVPVASGAAFNFELDPRRDDLAPIQSGRDAASHDVVLYPSAQFAKAGFIVGRLRAAESGEPLEGFDVSALRTIGPGSTNIGWAQTCSDGYYSMKLPVGEAYLATYDPMGARVQLWAPGVFCAGNARTTLVLPGATTAVDFSVPRSVSIYGKTMLYREPLSGMVACASGGALESGCAPCGGPTGADGAFRIDLPAGNGYRLEAWGNSMDRCYPHNECAAYVPVNAPATGLTINFGDAPAEASAAWLPTMVGRSSGNFVLTFPAVSGADSYNVYGGALGAFYDPSAMRACHLAAGAPGFSTPGAGVATYTFAPPAGNALWFLVSGSNVVGEGTLGAQRLGDGSTPERDGTMSAQRCGPTP